MRVTFIIGLLVASVVCYGQGIDSSATANVLTFDEAVKIALENSVRLNQEKNNLQLSQAQKLFGYAGLGPSVQGSLSASRNDGNSFNNNTGQVVNGINDNVSGSISANLNIFSGFYQINTIRQFSSQLQSQNYLVHRTAQDAINTVSTQYLQVMLDAELLIIAKENFDALDKQLVQIKELVRLGARSPVDEFNQDAQTKAAELRYVQAEIMLNNDKALLAQTLLLDPFISFEVERPNWDVNMFGSDPINLEDLANRAKQSRGDYLSAVKLTDAQRYAMYATRGLMLPSVSAFFRYGSAYNKTHGVSDSIPAGRTVVVTDPLGQSPTGFILDNQPLGYNIVNPGSPRPFDEQFRVNNVYKSYGFSITIPIFNGLQNRTNHVRNKIQYRNAQLTRNNLELQIKNDVVRAVRNYQGAKRAFSITSDQLRSAEVALQLETERYNLGVTNFVEYATANRVYVQAQTDKAQAEYRLVFQKILLEYAVGTLKTETASVQN
jgi:outer membrane protein